MTKEKKTKQTNGKGDKNRVTDKKQFDKNWDKIFGKGKKVNKVTKDDMELNPEEWLNPRNFKLSLNVKSLEGEVYNLLRKIYVSRAVLSMAF